MKLFLRLLLLFLIIAPFARANQPILWRHIDGKNAIWHMAGSTLASGGYVTDSGGNAIAVDASWKVAGFADFDGDGTKDILWRNSVSGQNSMWKLNGNIRQSGSLIGGAVDPSWKIVGSGDLDGDGKSDIVWRNSNSGETTAWLMDGFNITNAFALAQVPDQNWQIVAIADFTGNGKADLLWRNNISGQEAMWLMQGTYFFAYSVNSVDSTWRIVGAGDFDNDGLADILWRNSVTGLNAVWLMDGPDLKTGAALNGIGDQNWKVQDIEDYDGDGKADILWRRDGSGDDSIWFMDGPSLRFGALLPAVDANWSVNSIPVTKALPVGTPPPSPSLNLTGNWELNGTSFYGPFEMYGGMQQAGSDLITTMWIDSSCIAFEPIFIDGVVMGNTVIVQGADSTGNLLQFMGTSPNGSSVQGKYTGRGNCEEGDSGTIGGTRVTAVTGQITGTFVSEFAPGAVSVSGNVLQAPVDMDLGVAPLSGNVNFSGSQCFTSATIDPSTSFAIGIYIHIEAQSTNGGRVTFDAAGDTSATTYSGTYQITGGICAGDEGTGSITRH